MRNPEFVSEVAAATGGKKSCVVLIDMKGGDLDVDPVPKGNGTLDKTDSAALRAAFELCQAGVCKDVRYVR